MGIIADSGRLLDRRFQARLLGLAIASIAVSALDAVGVLLVVPLVSAMAGSTGAPSGISVSIFDGWSTSSLLVLMVTFFVFKSAGMAVIRWWSTGVVSRQNAKTTTDLFAAYLAADISFHDNRNSSESVATLTVNVRNYFNSGVTGLVTVVTESSTLTVLALVLLIASPLASGIGALYFGVMSILYLRVVQVRTQRRAKQALELNQQSIRSIQEAIGGLREHTVRGTARQLVERFAEQRKELEKANRFVAFASEFSRYFMEIMFIGGFGAVALALLQGSSDDQVLASLAIFLTVGFRILPSVSRLMGSANSIRIGRAALSSILDDLDSLGIESTPTRVTPERHTMLNDNDAKRPSEIRLECVSFGYSGRSDLALHEVSITLGSGQSLGVVGPSGAGKSTLVDVICGLQLPAAGRVLVDDQDIRDRLGLWQADIGFVPQHPYLLDATIADNVAFGLPCDDSRVWEALKRAQLETTVSEFDHQLEETVGERGARLSGGQRQRLAIARALYNRPSFLILDEATAALDTETEAAIVEAIERLSGEVTVLVVAHRLSTVLHCDQIVYLDQGRVRSAGPLKQVVAEVPEFARALNRTSAGGDTAVDLD